MLVSNHPQLAGGSHLPDITVITPVWEGGRVVFFVASRGHHAGVGWEVEKMGGSHLELACDLLFLLQSLAVLPEQHSVSNPIAC